MPIPSKVLKEAMTSISDAELLDCVRKLRQYMASLDNAYTVMGNLNKIEDSSVRSQLEQITPKVITISREIAAALRQIEGSRPYRDMLRKFNLDDEEDE